MAKPSKRQASSDEAMSNGSSSSEEEEQTNEQINEEEDEEELEAVARSAGSDEDEAADDSDNDTSPAENGEEEVNFELCSSIYGIHLCWFYSDLGRVFDFQFSCTFSGLLRTKVRLTRIWPFFPLLLYILKFEGREDWRVEHMVACLKFGLVFVLPKLYFLSTLYVFVTFSWQDGSNDGNDDKADISRREKARLRDMQKLKKQKIQDMLDAQNAAIDADMVC